MHRVSGPLSPPWPRGSLTRAATVTAGARASVAMMGLRVGVLDVWGNLEDTVRLGVRADALGYSRYWISEHRPQPSALLMATIVAGQTERIRVGTAGVLLHYDSPLQVATDFQMLERLFPDRIDAGFCAGGTSDAIAHDDLYGRDPRQVVAAFPERAERFVRHLRNTPAASSFDASTGWSGADEVPAIWGLGSGGRSTTVAATLGLHYAHALLYGASHDDPAPIARYRHEFVGRDAPAEPTAVLAVAGICAETDARAAELAAAHTARNQFFRPWVVGSGPTCAAALRALAVRYAVDEVVFGELSTAFDERAASLDLLAAHL